MEHPDRQIRTYMLLNILICIPGTNLGDISRNEVEDDPEAGSTVFVKYNRMLHGKRSDRNRKRDTLTINFLKKYIHYAKNRIQPELTDEVTYP